MWTVCLALAFGQEIVQVGPQGSDLRKLVGQGQNEAEVREVVKHYKLKRSKDEDAELGGNGICLDVDALGYIGGVRMQRADTGECPGAFTGELPWRLHWNMSEAEIQAAMGWGYARDSFGRPEIYWKDGAHYVHVELDGDRRLRALLVDSGWLLNAEEQLGSMIPAVGSKSQPVASRAGSTGSLGNQAPPANAPVASPSRPVASPSPSPAPRPVPSKPSWPSIDQPVRTGAKASGVAAVVVGIEDYPFLQTPVPFARRDAQAFADLLIYTVGVPQSRVQVLTAGSREQVLAAVDRAATEAGDGGTVWLYFAGHGAANPNSGDRMLLGDDVRADAVAFASRGVGVREVEERLAKTGRSARMVLDTCYAGTSRSGGNIAGGTRFAVPVYAAAPASTSASSQWNAAGPDQISGPLNDVQHGAFTYFAVGALRGWADGELSGTPDGQVTAEEAQAYVTRSLRASGKNSQTPVWVGADDVVLSTGTERAP